MKRIMIIGASGYIGSQLTQYLKQFYSVVTVDAGWFGNNNADIKADYSQLTASDFNEIDAVVLLAGHSSVKTCNGQIFGPWLNNVTNFMSLVDKIGDIPLIYASSASVYGNNIPGILHTEDETDHFRPVNNYDITKYVLDMHAQRAIKEGKNIIGLRFGTVNGWSPVLRADVMINSMVRSAFDNGFIYITNPHISRAILGIDDLCRAIHVCLYDKHSGIYNLSSFNLTVAEIAAEVALIMNVGIVDNGNTENAYDFGLNCNKFAKTFKFEFKETPATIIDTLVAKYNDTIIGARNDYIEYKENDGKR